MNMDFENTRKCSLQVVMFSWFSFQDENSQGRSMACDDDTVVPRGCVEHECTTVVVAMVADLFLRDA